MAFTWGWNLNSKLLPALVVETMSMLGGQPPVGPFHKSGDYIFIHSVRPWACCCCRFCCYAAL